MSAAPKRESAWICPATDAQGLVPLTSHATNQRSPTSFMNRPLQVSFLACVLTSHAQTILPPDPNEPSGQRPYEMVWANRVESAAPTLRFDQLDGWKVEVKGGAQATLQVTRAQNVWNRPVARLRYRGEGKGEAKPRIS